MTYNMFSGTLNPTQSVNQSVRCFYCIWPICRLDALPHAHPSASKHWRQQIT